MPSNLLLKAILAAGLLASPCVWADEFLLGYDLIRDEGASETRRGAINFLGAAVSVADDSSNNETEVTIAGSGLTGPASSTDNAVTRWNGTGGTALQNSNLTLSDVATDVLTLTFDTTFNDGLLTWDGNALEFQSPEVWRLSNTLFLTGLTLDASAFTATTSALTANVPLTMNSSTKLLFRDSTLYINSAADSFLDFTADGAFRFVHPVTDTDITMTFSTLGTPGATGQFFWMEDEDYFSYPDDILLSTTENLYWRDTAIHLNSSVDGQLDIDADGEVEITAPILDVNASTGLALDGANLNSAWTVNTTNKLQFRDTGIFIHSNADGEMTIEADAKVTIGVAGTIDLGDATLRVMRPQTDSKIDLGDLTHEFNDMFVDGTVETDALRIDEGGSTTISSGTGTVKMSSVNNADNAAWIPINYNGTVYYVPGWTTNSP